MASSNFALNLSSLFLSVTIFFCFCLSSEAKFPYAEHCNAVVPQPTSSRFSVDTSSSIYISGGYFSGRGKFSNGKFNFYTNNVYRTQTPGTVYITGRLTTGSTSSYSTRVASFSLAPHRLLESAEVANFQLSGFWSKPMEKICMTGTGSLSQENGTSSKLSAMFTLDYPKDSNISYSIVSGKLESLDDSNSPSHFDKISVLGYAQNNYIYTQMSRVSEICSRVEVPKLSLGLETTSDLQNLLPGEFQLEYERGCSAEKCSPFSTEFLPSFMNLNVIHTTEEGKVHMYIGFSNGSARSYGNFLVPGNSLVAEGYWDLEKKLLCLLACPVIITKENSKNSFVGDCTIGLSFWFPGIFTIKDRSNIAGRIWSLKGDSDPGYFGSISFRSLGGNIDVLPGAKYEYTKTHSMMTTCSSTKVVNYRNERYPNENSVEDLRFDLYVRPDNGSSMWGYATPLSIGDRFYGFSFSGISSDVYFFGKNHSSSQSLLNVSYTISYRSYNSLRTYISAEGVYNSRTGKFCMIGCKLPEESYAEDCKIQISIQLSPLKMNNEEHVIRNSSGSTRHLNGTIWSTRKKSDPLYFGPLEISSYGMYSIEAMETVARMDMEIIMVIISLTFSCIFNVLQIFHVRKNHGVLPSISITMLVVLTLGHMVPLVLNFESLFVLKQRRNNVTLSGGWLEVNEVIVRVMTMVAFLLQLRLLQLVWTARSSNESKTGIWIGEWKVLRFCLPFYLAGGLIAWFVHSKTYETQGGRMIWTALISYVGLILDGFLLPQIIVNVISNSKDKALTPIFYMGTTAVHALPHLYDVYRAHNYMPYLNFSYIYASPDGDYYSTVSDIIIPLGGAFLTTLIFLQQKFGGRCFLPHKFRRFTGYEAVPVITA
ncbi:uncharacterized protein A4U43_C06F15700 [Asparagus officinalis]|uniref:RING-type E3 ubiquitin transferase n=1 Tax=Asparagus officinalis TaxID=4686 RepID=A0A5P1EQM3_ASPOF|nr:uncharacterized protein LOC109845325 [Asparagus officinalis]XP_020270152.1 uncharacterized protein LOC109845325 [Asparagus officinalis]XP_020270153.1 uncharacterized protein LOC109845325 [Asparagus officinalis]ONK67099.1 uncharacterized protein A4U43_C06F15700 [Asparagus officinalis]